MTRGVSEVIVKEDLRKKLASGKRLRIYCGFDPTAASLHIGNAILLNKLSQFQALGHEVIFLIGDFTGMIGDPTDKLASRKRLTRAQVKINAKDFKKQAAVYLKFNGANPAKVLYNSAWNNKLSFAGLLDLAWHFTHGQMIAREMFQQRLKDDKPIFLPELLYPLVQAYDSVAMDVDVEIGGNDQMFNMLCGRDLMKALGKKDKSVLTMKLLVDADGGKMGKTTGNALFLDTGAEDMYGIIMSWPDEVIVSAWELVTKEPMEAIEKLARTKPRDAKMKLALTITSLVHGDKYAHRAEAHFISAVQKKEAPTDLKIIKIRKGDNLLSACVYYFGTVKSKSDIRRLFEQGAVEVDGVKVRDCNEIAKSGGIVKVGKRDWFEIS